MQQQRYHIIKVLKYQVNFYYYYQNYSQPDKFSVCLNSSNIIGVGSTNYILVYFDFGSNLRKSIGNSPSPVLQNFETQITKLTQILPNNISIYDFKL